MTITHTHISPVRLLRKKNGHIKQFFFPAQSFVFVLVSSNSSAPASFMEINGPHISSPPKLCQLTSCVTLSKPLTFLELGFPLL